MGLVLGNVADLCNLFMHVVTPTLSTISRLTFYSGGQLTFYSGGPLTDGNITV